MTKTPNLPDKQQGDKKRRASDLPTKPVSKQALYSMISGHVPSIVARLVKLSQSKNENVALGACKILLNKTLPDVKSVEVIQTNVLDSMMEEEVKRLNPSEAQNGINFDEMSEEEVTAYAQLKLEAAQALLRIGKYAPVGIAM